MKNVASIKSNSKNESPKTPGGISKSLLTPCRRVGLSRNWKKKGPSPFISPITSNISNNIEAVPEKRETRKRKSTVGPEEKSSENVDSFAEIDDISLNSNNAEEIVKTPLRNVELPRRKKSKTFLATLNSEAYTKEANSTVSQDIDECTKENETVNDPDDKDVDIETPNTEGLFPMVKEVTPQLKNSKATQKSKRFQSPLKSGTKTSSNSENTISVTAQVNIKETPKEVAKLKKKKSESKPLKIRSPNELTKECIVVIQKKLLKVKEKYNEVINDTPKKKSQPLFDSDDEAPLSTLNKKESDKDQTAITTLDDDDDEFIQTTSKNKSKKTESTNHKINDIKTTSKTNSKLQKPIKPQTSKITPSTESKEPSQSSFDDDDDDDFLDKKKTILIRKTYEKVVKPNKAKSTGSITQRDIDDIKARIELKKKMLLASSMTAETEELRSLIKKWQKGCQEALVELMDLMKIKCPDRHSMDYSEILQMLKIPASLVGYDSDHDCFNTPDDNSAVLSKYNDF